MMEICDQPCAGVCRCRAGRGCRARAEPRPPGGRPPGGPCAPGRPGACSAFDCRSSLLLEEFARSSSPWHGQPYAATKEISDLASRIDDADEAGHSPPYQAADMVRTTRYSALPLVIRSYASAARSRGNVSIMGRTPVRTEKLSVSSESAEVPAGQP